MSSVGLALDEAVTALRRVLKVAEDDDEELERIVQGGDGKRSVVVFRTVVVDEVR